VIICDDDLYTNLMTDTFEKSPSSSHLSPFMADMFDVRPPMILSLPGFLVMENYGLSSEDALEPLMVPICPSLHPLLSKVSTGIEKAFFRRTVSAYVTLTCSSHIFFRAGKVLQLMLGYGLTHWRKGFLYLKDSIILRMQDILIARNSLFLFVVFGIIFRSGALLVFGMCLV
jgi:hypothetical protein